MGDYDAEDLKEVRLAALEDAIADVMSESEFSSEPPPGMITLFLTDPVVTIRAVAGLVKKNIVFRIKKRISDESKP